MESGFLGNGRRATGIIQLYRKPGALKFFGKHRVFAPWLALFVCFLVSLPSFADHPRPGLVSVIMTTFNREALVLEAVDSILRQTYQDWELIVVDDASTDGTWNLLQNSVEDSRIRIYRLSQNVGMYAASNYALKHWVKGEYVTWQDSDDTSHPHRLERQVRHMKNHDIDAVSIAHRNLITGENYYADFPEYQGPVRTIFPLRRFSRHPERTHFSMTRGLFRTDRVLQIGGFEGRRRISMDAQFVDRYLKMFSSGGITDEPLYFYHPRGDSLTVARATAFGSRARTKVTLEILGNRCTSNLLWYLGARRAFERFQTADLYYPPGLEAEMGATRVLSAVGH